MTRRVVVEIDRITISGPDAAGLSSKQLRAQVAVELESRFQTTGALDGLASASVGRIRTDGAADQTLQANDATMRPRSQASVPAAIAGAAFGAVTR